MKLANVKIVTKDTRCTELVVDGVHLENTVRGYALTHYAGEAPVLHLDIWVDDLELEEQAADCEAEHSFENLLAGFGQEVTVDAHPPAPDLDAGYIHG